MDDLDEEKKILQSKIEKVERNSLESMYFNAYAMGHLRLQMAKGYNYKEDDKKYYWSALRGLSNALRYAVKGGHNFDETYQSVSKKKYFYLLN